MLWFQLSDCYRGVVFDSLETLFARNAATALLCLLKAIGNREHIYVINMAQDYTAMKAREKAKNEQEGKAIPCWAVLPSPIGLSFKQSSRLLGSFPAVSTDKAYVQLHLPSHWRPSYALEGGWEFLFLLCM